LGDERGKREEEVEEEEEEEAAMSIHAQLSFSGIKTRVGIWLIRKKEWMEYRQWAY